MYEEEHQRGQQCVKRRPKEEISTGRSACSLPSLLRRQYCKKSDKEESNEEEPQGREQYMKRGLSYCTRRDSPNPLYVMRNILVSAGVLCLMGLRSFVKLGSTMGLLALCPLL